MTSLLMMSSPQEECVRLKGAAHGGDTNVMKKILSNGVNVNADVSGFSVSKYYMLYRVIILLYMCCVSTGVMCLAVSVYIIITNRSDVLASVYSWISLLGKGVVVIKGDYGKVFDYDSYSTCSYTYNYNKLMLCCF